MSNKIKHSGVVDGVDGTTVRVRILQSSACSACKVASHCNASETKEKLVEVMPTLPRPLPKPVARHRRTACVKRVKKRPQRFWWKASYAL